jgi:hypothetical protein
MRRRGEYIVRPFADLYETGAMRRKHLPGRDDIRRAILIHASTFDLSLVLGGMFQVGTPRGFQGGRAVFSAIFALGLQLCWRVSGEDGMTTGSGCCLVMTSTCRVKGRFGGPPDAESGNWPLLPRAASASFPRPAPLPTVS